jgi:hypothetical protein
MINTVLDRTGAACGVVFPIVLFLAAGDGGHTYDPARAAVGVWAIALALPFVGYVSALIHRQEGTGGWLAPAALVSGTAGVAIKMVSEVSALSAHRAGIGSTGQMHDVLTAMGAGATVICLAPLAIFCAAVAASVLSAKAFPRWVGTVAALTAIGLAVNSVFLGADFVPAFLLFMAWSLLIGVYRLVAARQTTTVATAPAVAHPRS